MFDGYCVISSNWTDNVNPNGGLGFGQSSVVRLVMIARVEKVR